MYRKLDRKVYLGGADWKARTGIESASLLLCRFGLSVGQQGAQSRLVPLPLHDCYPDGPPPVIVYRTIVPLHAVARRQHLCYRGRLLLSLDHGRLDVGLKVGTVLRKFVAALHRLNHQAGLLDGFDCV